MCGIGGFLVADAPPPARELEARLWAMIATLRHRGPDDEGVWTDGRAGLAHARLSIIDTTPAGHQPMACVDASVWISYNGEVYNFAELRKELAAHFLSVAAHPDGYLGEPELVRYWTLPEIGGTRRLRPVEELRRELITRLEEAVRRRLVSDVPLGAFLSGGVDSSAVVAM